VNHRSARPLIELAAVPFLCEQDLDGIPYRRVIDRRFQETLKFEGHGPPVLLHPADGQEGPEDVEESLVGNGVVGQVLRGDAAGQPPVGAGHRPGRVVGRHEGAPPVHHRRIFPVHDGRPQPFPQRGVGPVEEAERLAQIPPVEVNFALDWRVDRVVAALDADRGEVVDHGWTRKTGRNVIERMRALRSLVGGFLVTFVEREGRLQGLPMDEAQRLVEEAGDARLTVAGGVRESAEIAQADRLCADVQVGMALYTKRFSLAEGFASPLRSERTDGLWPTIVCNQRGEALGLAYSNVDSLSEAIETGRGVYFSRSRGRMWRKGETSGAEQRLLRVDVDCDRDTLRFIVDQAGGGFCHTGEHTCFGEATGLSALERTIHGRLRSASDDSYTRRLLNDPTLLAEKTLEEAGEVIAAKSREETVWEAADLLYFLMVRLAREGLSLSEVERELDRRARRVKRFNAETKENTP